MMLGNASRRKAIRAILKSSSITTKSTFTSSTSASVSSVSSLLRRKQSQQCMISHFSSYNSMYTNNEYNRNNRNNNSNDLKRENIQRSFSTSNEKKDDKKETNESSKESNQNEDANANEDTNEETNKNESFRDTINRIQGEHSSSDSSSSSSSSDETLHKLSSAYSSFTTSLSETWHELLHSNQPQDVNKKLTPSKSGNKFEDDNEAADKYEGTTAIMIIDEEENLNAYERIQRRLSEAPLIQEILRRADNIYEESGASAAKEKVSHIREDAQEAWETSQNPWVYRVSSVYDTVTAESETTMAERELRILDPSFSLESWKHGLVEVTLPKFMKLFLEGRIKELKPFLGEAVYNRFAAESRARKKEGVYVDTNVLSVMNMDIASCVPDTLNKGSPLITIYFSCQQINCVRKKETGEIVEGSEDDIRAYMYLVTMQREYDEEKGELNWKILDFMLNGAVAYL